MGNFCVGAVQVLKFSVHDNVRGLPRNWKDAQEKLAAQVKELVPKYWTGLLKERLNHWRGPKNAEGAPPSNSGVGCLTLLAFELISF
jgi:hypothetical protein